MTQKEGTYEVSWLGLLPIPTLALIFSDTRCMAEKPAEALRQLIEETIAAKSEGEQYRFCEVVTWLREKF